MARKTTPTNVLLNQIELSSPVSSVTFSAIPQGYGDLVLVASVPSSSETIDLYPNGVSSNLSLVWAYGYAPSNNNSATDTAWTEVSSGTRPRLNIYNLMDYSATDKHKTVLSRQNFGDQTIAMMAGRWASTTAISSLLLNRSGGANFPSGSIFSIYGVYA